LGVDELKIEITETTTKKEKKKRKEKKKVGLRIWGL